MTLSFLNTKNNTARCNCIKPVTNEYNHEHSVGFFTQTVREAQSKERNNDCANTAPCHMPENYESNSTAVIIILCKVLNFTRQ